MADDNAPVFSLTPATADEGFLDFNVKRDKQTFYKAVEKLSEDEFDCVEENLNDFMILLKARADEFGWTERIMNIPITEANDPNPREANLLTEHASASMEQIRNYEMTYVNDESRERQDMMCLYKCLIASLSQVGRNKVNTDKNQYILKDDLERDAYSGNLLLKVILNKSVVDNRSGAYAIRMELSELPDLIAKINFNITKFNTRVKTLVNDLSRRGETSADLTFNLFRAYKSVPVPEFITFIDRIKDEQDEKEDGEQDSEIYLMDKAENKYRILTKEGTWHVKEKENEKFLALEARLNKYIKENKKLRAAGNKPTKRTTKKTQKVKVDIHRKPRDINKPVVINGDKWYWCSTETGGKCSGALRKHKPSECKGREHLANKQTDKDKPKKASLKVKEVEIAPSASEESEP